MEDLEKGIDEFAQLVLCEWLGQPIHLLMVIIWDSEAHSMEQQTVIYEICVKKLPTNVDVLGNKDISCYVPRIALKHDFIVLLSFVRFYFHKKLKFCKYVL